MRCLFYLVILVVGLGPAACNSDNDVKKDQKITQPLLKKFEAVVNKAMKTYEVPGVAIAIVEGDEIVYAEGFGLRHLEKREPVTPYTVFVLNSMGQAMTSTMVATLVDDGALDWNQRVVEISPYFTLPTEELTNNVQVRHLMQMNTGIAVDSIRLFYDGRLNGISAEEQLESLAKLSVVAELEQTFYYNPQIYAAIGHISALAYGAAYGDLFNGFKQLMQERLFNAIGMESAGLSVDISAVSNDYANGYAFNYVNRTFEPVLFLKAEGYAAAGMVSANVIDVARFLITQLNQGLAPNGTRVVSAQNLIKTQLPQIKMDSMIFDLTYPLAQSLYYGMGWVIVEQSNGVQVIGHSGGGEGFVSDMAFIPDANIGIVVLTNLNFSHGVLNASRFVAVVRASLFELLYNLEPKVAEEMAKQHQQATKEAALPWETMLVKFEANTVAPFLGNYEKGWQLELRSDQTLWLVLLEVYEYQLVLLEDGTYRMSNNAYAGSPVSFSKSEAGVVTMTINVAGPEELAKID